MLSHAIAEGERQLVQEHQPVALGKHREQSRNRGHDRTHGNELLDDRPLARRRDGGIRQHPTQAVVTAHGLGEGRELALDAREVQPFFQHDLEQRTGVTRGGHSGRHGASWLCPGPRLASCVV